MSSTKVRTNDGTVSKKKYFYTASEFASILTISRSCVYAMIESQKIPCKRVGRRILIPADFVIAYINAA